MSISFAAKKRIRKNYQTADAVLDIPYLLNLQRQSYELFLQESSKSASSAKGLDGALRAIFPILGTSENAEIEYLGYRSEPPEYTVPECRQRGLTYGVMVYIKLRLSLFDKEKSNAKKKVIKEAFDQEVLLGDIPKMTENGTFILNGTERVVVSQLHRSPGVIFNHDKGRSHSSGKVLFNARIIPYRGSWLDFEFDHADILYARIDRHRKFHVSALLRAMGMSDEEMLLRFCQTNKMHFSKNSIKMEFHPEQWKGVRTEFELIHNGEVLVADGSIVTGRHVADFKKREIKHIDVPVAYAIGRVSAVNIYDKDKNLLVEANAVLTEELVALLQQHRKMARVCFVNDNEPSSYMSETLRADPTLRTELGARIEIYRMIRPGDPPTVESANRLFNEQLFFDEGRYDLSSVGRMKLNRRLRRKSDAGEHILTRDDVLDVIQELINIKNNISMVDDIDTLANRRVKAIGELAENACRIGLARVERVVRERLNQAEAEGWMPQDLINPKPITGALREFFGSSQLSQFMDQVNPLAEITHKRRISALGPGGLTRDRAGFEVRDVHPTHYGRLCPIETPEGPNIGLMNSLAIYARTNEYGFLETPYLKVENRKVSREVVWISAITEGDYYIAPANVALDDARDIVEDIVPSRHLNENLMVQSDKINLMDVSTKQIVSVAASLIPFLEHDDANRALMGSNMQRQAVPTLRPEKPLVGTGMEYKVAGDSGNLIIARRAGTVQYVDANRVVVKVAEADIQKDDIGVDIYTLRKYDRSNQNTCINQRPIVAVGDALVAGDVIADGSSSDLGELALGKNMRVAFMPWNGYNFEDSILISEKVVRENTFSSIHIIELSCIARATKQGDEEITADIPNLSDGMLNKLDENGIIHLGSEVKGGDILVGKITPKGDVQQSPEEKLLLAIFGEKATNVKDTSLRVPEGTEGVVTDIQIFTRQGLEKDSRAISTEEEELARFRKDLDDQLAIAENTILARIADLVIGKKDANGKVISQAVFDGLDDKKRFKVRTEDAALNKQVDALNRQLEALKTSLKDALAKKEEKTTRGDELPPGVLKMVKVHMAVKRNLAPGDKMAGRHGNKGVVSRIAPVEDMPFDIDGNPVDIILNPLGVPSRMNVGQILEVHLGAAARALGQQVEKMLRKEANVSKVRKTLTGIYKSTNQHDTVADLDDASVWSLANNLKRGVPIATPVFDGVSEEEIKKLLSESGLPTSGQIQLFDGQTGEAFERPVTVGYMYILKLNHLVDDKMHARSTGSYSLITQQPLGGKAQFGGQRFGEMEVWALEAYGAAHVLQEVLTVKSDDLSGRTQTYKNIIDGHHHMDSKVPESLNVLLKEIRSLGLDIHMNKSGDNRDA